MVRVESEDTAVDVEQPDGEGEECVPDDGHEYRRICVSSEPGLGDLVEMSVTRECDWAAMVKDIASRLNVSGSETIEHLVAVDAKGEPLSTPLKNSSMMWKFLDRVVDTPVLLCKVHEQSLSAELPSENEASGFVATPQGKNEDELVSVKAVLSSAPTTYHSVPFRKSDEWEDLLVSLRAAMGLSPDCGRLDVSVVDEDGADLSTELCSVSRLWKFVYFNADTELKLVVRVESEETVCRATDVLLKGKDVENMSLQSFALDDGSVMLTFYDVCDVTQSRTISVPVNCGWDILNAVVCKAFNLDSVLHFIVSLVLVDDDGDIMSSPIHASPMLWKFISHCHFDTDMPGRFAATFNNLSCSCDAFNTTEQSDAVVIDITTSDSDSKCEEKRSSELSIHCFLTGHFPAGRSVVVRRDMDWDEFVQEVSTALSLEDTQVTSVVLCDTSNSDCYEPVTSVAALWDSCEQLHAQELFALVNTLRVDQFNTGSDCNMRSAPSTLIALDTDRGDHRWVTFEADHVDIYNLWDMMGRTLELSDTDEIKWVKCVDSKGSPLGPNLSTAEQFIRFNKKMTPLFPTLRYLVTLSEVVSSRAVAKSFDDPSLNVTFSVVYASGKQEMVTVAKGSKWNDISTCVLKPILATGTTGQLQSLVPLDDSGNICGPPIVTALRFWECIDNFGRSMRFRVTSTTRRLLQPDSMMHALTTSPQRAINSRNIVLSDQHVSHIATQPFSSVQRSTGETFENVLFRLEKGSRVVSVGLSPDCDWEEMTKAVKAGLGIDEWSEMDSVVLLDEDGDEVTGKLTTSSKFWKSFVKKYYAKQGVLYVVHLKDIEVGDVSFSHNDDEDANTENPDMAASHEEVQKVKVNSLKADFLRACEKGSVEDALKCIKEGADVHCYLSDGRGAVHLAAVAGNIGVLKLLREHDVNLDSHDDEGMTPLAYACQESRVDVAKWLVNHEASLLTPNSMGLTPFHYVCLNGLDKLLQYADQSMTRIVTPTGLSALHCASYRGHSYVIKHLLSNHADPNCTDSAGSTPLHFAAANNHVEATKYLISFGSSINRRDMAGFTPFLSACDAGHLDVAKALAEAGASVSLSDKNGNSALHLACQNGRNELIEWLAISGMRADLRNADGVTASQICRLNRNKDLAAWLDSLCEGNREGEKRMPMCFNPCNTTPRSLS